MNGRRVPVEELSERERAAMTALMDRHFLGVTAAVFARDLAGKDVAVLLEDDHGALHGFTTLALVETRHRGEELVAVYSGDTIVERGARQSFVLASTWIATVRALAAGLGGRRLVWLLICSGHRTYRFLPVFFRDFHPRREGPTPPAAQALLDQLAGERYGAAYDPATGIVRLADPQPLRPLPAAPAEAEGGPDRVWFERRNPGYAAGDELACLCELGDHNLSPAGWRMVRLGERAARSGGF